jgi:hypothetical protein
MEMALWIKQNLTAGYCGDNWLAKNEGRGWEGSDNREKSA